MRAYLRVLMLFRLVLRTLEALKALDMRVAESLLMQTSNPNVAESAGARACCISLVQCVVERQLASAPLLTRQGAPSLLRHHRERETALEQFGVRSRGRKEVRHIATMVSKVFSGW